MAQTEFTVEGMSCQHCVKTVTEALESLDGVKAAKVDLDSKSAQVEYEDASINDEKLFEAVRAKEYTPVKKN